MRILKTIILISVVIFFSGAALQAAENAGMLSSEDYTIGEGDLLYVSVWKDQTLTRQLTVLPGGKISFPLVGEMMAGGKTVSRLQSELSAKINRFVPDPNLTVEVQAVNSLNIYVIGQVHRPGRFPLNTRIDVLQALAMAGGVDTFARRGKIKIFRNNGGERQTYLFDYDEVTEGKHPEQNILLDRGDVIVVP